MFISVKSWLLQPAEQITKVRQILGIANLDPAVSYFQFTMTTIIMKSAYVIFKKSIIYLQWYMKYYTAALEVNLKKTYHDN